MDKKENEIAPDHIIHEGMDKATVFYEKNKKQLFTIIGGLLVVVLGYFGYQKLVAAPNESEAEEKLFMAQKYFEKDSFDLALKGRPTDPGAFMGLVDVAEEYGSTQAGNIAKYCAGMCYLKKGEYENAINYLEDFHASDEIIAPIAEGALGDANVELGNFEEAVKHFMKASQMSKNKFTAPLYLKKAGLVYEELKQYGKAAEVYEIIRKDYKETTEGMEIEKYIARAKAMESNS